jgi:hypothetical protein
MAVTVADDCFDQQGEEWSGGDGWHISPGVMVASDETEPAAAALHAAGQRWMFVDEHGVELDEWQVRFGDALTPSWVSDVFLTNRGPALVADTDGELPRPQGEAMLRIVVEELERSGVSAHVTAPDSDPLGGGLPTWKPPTSDTPAEPEAAAVPSAWFVARDVYCVTTTGRPYEDCEYRAADGSWVWERTAAEQFAKSPVAMIYDLRREPRPPNRGSVNGLYLPADNSDWLPLPPIKVRQRPS